MKVVLVQCPNFSTKSPPLGIATLSSFLKNNNVDVTCFDFNAEDYNNKPKILYEFMGYLSFLYYRFGFDILSNLSFYNYENNVKRILNKNPWVVGFTIYKKNFLYATNFAKKIKEKNSNVKIVFGGPSFSSSIIGAYSKKWKLDHIDYIVLGEGEPTFLEIIDNISKNQEKEILGAINVKDSIFIYPGDTNRIFNMNTLLLPDFSDFNMSHYGFIPINTSRGCIKRCVFCRETKYWKFYHSMSPEKIFSEIKTLKEKYKISNFRFTDSLVNASIKNLELLCDLLINSSLNIKWGGFARLDPMMDRGLLKKMKDSGCVQLNFGVDSGSQKILDLMKKDYNIAEMEQVIKNTSDVGIKVTTNWIIGFPNESLRDFLLSIKFLIKNIVYIDTIRPPNICGLIPGTELYDNSQDFGITNKNSFLWKTKNVNIFTRFYRKIFFNIVKFSAITIKVIYLKFNSFLHINNKIDNKIKTLANE